ncbi:transcriptional activator [Scheffersomyces amazonensis]|uniref:transcriptional activator n=2 Tax=Scheffersomyces TaxID=766733 RepID=UPI00315CA8CF
MTDIKRNFSEIYGNSPASSSYDTPPPDGHDDKKLHTKPGRKPIETEPKSKRTAQNRAAQRAYRERKERKMKDLEDKVKNLEDKNIKVTTEADFLKAQVEMLKKELSRYRGHTDFSDLHLPTKVGHLSNPKTGGYVPTFENNNTSNNDESSASSVKSVSDHPSTSSSATDNSPHQQQFSIDFPWSKDNLRNSSSASANQQQQVPDLVSGSSSSTSPLNDNLLVSPDSSVTSGHTNSNIIASNLDFTTTFEEQVDPFCVKLSEACGTKQCPVPKYKRSDSKGSVSTNAPILGGGQDQQQHAQSQNNAQSHRASQSLNQFNSPFSNLVTPTPNQLGSDLDYLNDPFFNGTADGFNFDLSNNNNNNSNNTINHNSISSSVSSISTSNHNNTNITNNNNTPATTTSNASNKQNNDPLSFLNDNNFDVSLAFADPSLQQPRHSIVDDFDPISLLTTEESIYDPLKNNSNNNNGNNGNSSINVNFNFNEFVKSSLPSETTPKDRNYTTTASVVDVQDVAADDDDDDNLVVPAPAESMRCSEIWDRITAHPKYTEIDIDSLCNELKNKAKCSEKGVVINSADVNQLLEQSAMLKR